MHWCPSQFSFHMADYKNNPGKGAKGWIRFGWGKGDDWSRGRAGHKVLIKAWGEREGAKWAKKGGCWEGGETWPPLWCSSLSTAWEMLMASPWADIYGKGLGILSNTLILFLPGVGFHPIRIHSYSLITRLYVSASLGNWAINLPVYSSRVTRSFILETMLTSFIFNALT
jgi:hypothetical protein